MKALILPAMIAACALVIACVVLLVDAIRDRDFACGLVTTTAILLGLIAVAGLAADYFGL